MLGLGYPGSARLIPAVKTVENKDLNPLRDAKFKPQ